MAIREILDYQAWNKLATLDKIQDGGMSEVYSPWMHAYSSLVTSAEEGGYVFTSVCLSVRRITEKVVNGFWRNFLQGMDQVITLWWRSRSPSGSRSQESEIWIHWIIAKSTSWTQIKAAIANLHCKNHSGILLWLALGGGLCCLSIGWMLGVNDTFCTIAYTGHSRRWV